MPSKKSSLVPEDVNVRSFSPGERLPGETSKAYNAFRTYLELGPERSLENARSRLGYKTIYQLSIWSVRWRWLERISFWDQEANKKQSGAFLDEMEKMGRRHARIASQSMVALLQPIEDLKQRVEEAKAEGTRLRFGSNTDLMKLILDMPRALRALTDIERLAYGQHTDSHEVKEKDDETKSIAQRITNDPEASRLANELLESIAPGSSYPGVVGTPDE